jgi:hypothetical protein
MGGAGNASAMGALHMVGVLAYVEHDHAAYRLRTTRPRLLLVSSTSFAR